MLGGVPLSPHDEHNCYFTTEDVLQARKFLTFSCGCTVASRGPKLSRFDVRLAIVCPPTCPSVYRGICHPRDTTGSPMRTRCRNDGARPIHLKPCHHGLRRCAMFFPCVSDFSIRPVEGETGGMVHACVAMTGPATGLTCWPVLAEPPTLWVSGPWMSRRLCLAFPGTSGGTPRRGGRSGPG